MAQSALTPEVLQKMMKDVIESRDRALALPNSFIEKCMGAGIGDLGFGKGGMARAEYPMHSHAADAFNYGIGAGGGGAGGHTHTITTAQAQARPGRWSEQNLYDMLASRMGWNVANTFPFKRLVPYKVSDEKVAIFIVTGTDALVFSDDPYLYPSDALITQLRLLVEAL